MRVSFLALAMVATAGTATAKTTLSIPLTIGEMDSVTSQTYSCAGGEPFSVQYVNAGANALAILPIDGEDRIFVNVVSASGARYVSGALVWWSKGETATLENELEEGSHQDCQSQDALPSE